MNEILEKTKSAKMGRLRKLGIELDRTTRTAEEEAASRAPMAEHLKMSRRMTMSPGVPDWFWAEEEKMREEARLTVVAWREAKEKSASASNSASRPADGSDKSRPSSNPFKAAYETFKKSRHPEDLVEFERRLALFGQLVREEAAKGTAARA